LILLFRQLIFLLKLIVQFLFRLLWLLLKMLKQWLHLNYRQPIVRKFLCWNGKLKDVVFLLSQRYYDEHVFLSFVFFLFLIVPLFDYKYYADLPAFLLMISPTNLIPFPL